MRRAVSLAFVGPVAVLLAACTVPGPTDGPVPDTKAAATVPVATPKATQPGAITTTEPPTAPARSAGPVAIADFRFTPAVVSVGVGESTTFRNDDEFEHQIRLGAGASGLPGSPRLAQGETWTFLPTEATTIVYSCAIHNSMTGTIEVGRVR